MKVLMIISEAPPVVSGIARAADEICTRLISQGHVVDIVSCNEIPRIALGELRLSSMLWKGIKPVLRRLHEYDIVHIHGPVPTFSDVALLFAGLARRTGGPPIVYTHHCEIELPGKELLSSPYNFVHRTLARLADQVVVYTPSYAESFAPFLPPDRISVIPGAGSEQRAAISKPEGFNVLFVGQLRPYKGLEVLLRAFRNLQDAKLTIVGTGHREAYYRALARQLGLENVHFLGKASEAQVDAAYADAHTLVLPSLTRAEAFGLVLLEGMAARCVPIASRLPGVKDVVGEVGYTFEPGDHEALTAILRSLQHDRGLLHRLSAAAKEWAGQFSWDTTAEAYDQLYLALRQGRAHPSQNRFPRPVRPSEARRAPEPASSLPVLAGDTNAEDDPEVIVRMFEAAAASFDASDASLLLKLPAEDVLVISAQKGLSDGLLGARVALEGSVSGWVASEDRPTVIDEQHAPSEIRRFMRRPDLRSALSVPFHHGDQVVGVLNLGRRAVDQPYTHEDLDGLVTFVEAWQHANAGRGWPLPVAQLAA